MSGRSSSNSSHKLDMSYILNSGEDRPRRDAMDVDIPTSSSDRRPPSGGGERKHICPECPKRFLSKGDMTKHVNGVHRGIKLHSCPKCDSRFGEKGNLTKHMKRHEGVREFQCSVGGCSKKFVLRDGLIRHEKDVHSLGGQSSSSRHGSASSSSVRRQSSHYHSSSRPRE